MAVLGSGRVGAFEFVKVTLLTVMVYIGFTSYDSSSRRRRKRACDVRNA